MKGIAAAGTVVALLLAAATAPADPLMLDAASFRAEVASRLTGYTGRLDGNLLRKQKGLQRAIEALDSPSSTLEGDLRIVRWTAKALDRPFRGDARLMAHQDALEERAARLVRGTREGLATCVPAVEGMEEAAEAALRLARADRRLADAEAAPTRERRLALPARGLGELRRGLAAVEADAGGPLATGSMEYDHSIPPSPLIPWVPDFLSATVTLDAEGNPQSLELLMFQAPDGGPVTSRLRISIAEGFTGTGFYDAPGDFDPDMAGSITSYYFQFQYGGPPTALEITTWDPAGGRIAGLFHYSIRAPVGYQPGSIKNGVFDIRAPIIVRQP